MNERTYKTYANKMKSIIRPTGYSTNVLVPLTSYDIHQMELLEHRITRALEKAFKAGVPVAEAYEIVKMMNGSNCALQYFRTKSK